MCVHRDIARIATFDHWFENQDRHTGNILRTSLDDYIPIDNELILYTLVWAAIGSNRREATRRGSSFEGARMHWCCLFQQLLVLDGHLVDPAREYVAKGTRYRERTKILSGNC
jgi:hypothetical protein